MQEIAQRQNVGDGEFDNDDESSCSVWNAGAYDTKSGKPLPLQAVERLFHRSGPLLDFLHLPLIIPLILKLKMSRKFACMKQPSSNLPDHKIIIIHQSSKRNRSIRNNRMKVIGGSLCPMVHDGRLITASPTIYGHTVAYSSHTQLPNEPSSQTSTTA